MRYFAGFAESFYYAYSRGRQAFERAMPAHVANLDGCASRTEDIELIGLEERGLPSAPPSGPGSLGMGMAGRHPLVSGFGNRHKMDGVARHTWNSPISPGSFVIISSGIYVSTPEFTFLQLSRVASPITLALVGCALCASYRIDGRTGKIVERQPITSVERIRLFLEQAKGVYGKRGALHSLGFVADGAESPQEVNLYLLAALPLALGGAGIEGLRLNYAVTVEEGDSAIVDRPTRKRFRIDMGVPERCAGAEYLGKHHDLQQDKDRNRLNALLAKGQHVLQAKYRDISDPLYAERLINQLAAVVSQDAPVRTPSEELAHARLMDALFGWGRLQL